MTQLCRTVLLLATLVTQCLSSAARKLSEDTSAVQIEWDYDEFYSGEWGSLLFDTNQSKLRPTKLQTASPVSGVQDREDAIQKYLESNPDNINQALVNDYFAEVRYEASDNVVVPRPDTDKGVGLNLNATVDARAYDNMKIRLRNTRYNDVRPGPKVYYVPKNVTILAQVVKELNAAGTPYLIRGGGHSYEANTLPTGTETAVIDMAKFTNMDVTEEDVIGKDGVAHRELTFGTGMRLATLYVYMALKKLALVAGTCPANGSAGYYMGGGAGPAMRRVGWGSDQLIRAKVVLSNGVLAVADSDDSKALPGQTILPSDLLFALRGGGAGTAIVYEYTVRVYHIPETITRCTLSFSTTTKDAYQQYVKAWSDDWKIWQVDGAKYPFIRLYTTNNISRIVMDAWNTPAEELETVMLQGMKSAESIKTGTPTCNSYNWNEFLYETFVSYYSSHPEMIENIGAKNFTTPYLLAMDYIGWGYAGSDIPVAPPMSPYADFTAVAPTVNGPSSFSAQGLLSSTAWSATAAGRLWDEAISMGMRFYSYALGGILDDEVRGAAFDDAVGSATDALSHGVILTVTDVSTTNQDAMNLASAVAKVLDDLTVAKQPSRYYNFLNCYNNTDSETLFEMYYGEDVTQKLVGIKAKADPQSRLKTWCDI
jgi:hypothetical protein